MRKLLMVVALAALLGGAAYTAEKNYQFTGTVKTVTGNTFTVEKSAKEVWTFSTDSATKGAPKVGDKVTVYYKMVATEIEAKPAAPPTKKK
jgi:hypothetical protein